MDVSFFVVIDCHGQKNFNAFNTRARVTMSVAGKGPAGYRPKTGLLCRGSVCKPTELARAAGQERDKDHTEVHLCFELTPICSSAAPVVEPQLSKSSYLDNSISRSETCRLVMVVV